MTKVKSLIFFRLIITTVLVGSYLFFKIGPHPFQYHHLIKYLIYAVLFLSLVYLVLLKYIKKIYLFAYFQLVVDALFIIALIFMTGGVESWFSFLMVLNVIAGAIVIGRGAGFIIATILSILYGVMIDLQFYRIIPLEYDSTLKVTHFVYNIFIHISALYLVAYLAGYLTSRLEKTSKTLEKTEKDLTELKTLNTLIVENVPSGIVTADSAGRIIAFNTNAELITGLNRRDVIGKNITEIFPFLKTRIPYLHRESAIERENKNEISGLTSNLRFRTEGIIEVKGTQKIIGITVNSFESGEEATLSRGLIGVFQDLTDIKKAEDEAKRREKLAAIGELSRSIAHEIRNPLASLKGSVEMLLENKISEEQKRRLMEIAIKEMDRLNKIITDFLLYTRPAPPDMKTFDLIKLIDDIIIMLKSSPMAEKIRIQREGPNSLSVKADEAQLKQVFLNLGNNALEAMPDGGSLTISVFNERDSVRISFSDTGEGIKEEDLDKIFIPFYSTKENGSGLGLSIAYKIIEEHRGKISVRNNDPGTTFEVILPK
ncbi:MAG: ATP-binding protein [Thermodesulfovibrionales bacterium]|nr:ATP-binding protein [Thermodesulfovibrionales bacterium]